MLVRKYRTSDRKQVEDIHFETGFLGSSMSRLLSNNLLWKKNITYYLEKESESIFVLENKNKVVGYLFGCLNDANNNETRSFVLHTLKNLMLSLFLPRKDKVFWRNQFMTLLHTLTGNSEEMNFKTPKNAGHIHINLLPLARGRNLGTKLLKEFENYAKKKRIKLIHADSFRRPKKSNAQFWLKNGFTVYSEVKTSIWKNQLPDEQIDLVCYAKNLTLS